MDYLEKAYYAPHDFTYSGYGLNDEPPPIYESQPESCDTVSEANGAQPSRQERDLAQDDHFSPGKGVAIAGLVGILTVGCIWVAAKVAGKFDRK